MNKIVEMYNDGHELFEIVGELDLDVSEILESLRQFVEGSKKNPEAKSSSFKTEFKELLVSRYQSGYSLYAISKELNISTSTVSKYLKQAGIDTTKQDNKRYDVLDWDDFETCPCCKSKRNVRNLGLHNQENTKDGEYQHSFCVPCNNEWYKESGETRKVLWGLIN